MKGWPACRLVALVAVSTDAAALTAAGATVSAMPRLDWKVSAVPVVLTTSTCSLYAPLTVACSVKFHSLHEPDCGATQEKTW